MKAMAEGRLKKVPPTWKKGKRAESNRVQAREAWAKVATSLAAAAHPKDRLLAARIGHFLGQTKDVQRKAEIPHTSDDLVRLRERDTLKGNAVDPPRWSAR